MSDNLVPASPITLVGTGFRMHERHGNIASWIAYEAGMSGSNSQCDVIIATGNDAYRASGLSLPGDAMPAVGDFVAMTIRGRRVAGLVRYADDGYNAAAIRRQQTAESIDRTGMRIAGAALLFHLLGGSSR